jgi:hypothetical protein
MLLVLCGSIARYVNALKRLARRAAESISSSSREERGQESMAMPGSILEQARTTSYQVLENRTDLACPLSLPSPDLATGNPLHSYFSSAPFLTP